MQRYTKVQLNKKTAYPYKKEYILGSYPHQYYYFVYIYHFKSIQYIMKSLSTIIISTSLLISVLQTQAQQYFAFPTEDASWHCLNWFYLPGELNETYNYGYYQNGDTLINSIEYHKVYNSNTYIGALREDENKQIFFFPNSVYMDYAQFPNNTEEHLLYTFNNLEVGMDVEINGMNIYIQSIDSVHLNDLYRKRYLIQGVMIGPEYWIEGIGSDKAFFSAFSYGEFENSLYTLCYTDTETYYINSPNGQDSCHYQAPVGIEHFNIAESSFYPNPVTSNLTIKTTNYPAYLYLYNVSGQLLLQKEIEHENTRIDFSSYPNSVYIVELKQYNKIVRKKIIK